MKKGIFIGSTGQHVGKTTTCLGLVSGLKKRFSRVGFMKPVGQEHVEVHPDVFVDKDVILFKDYFSLDTPFEKMSPVLFPKGFTRQFLDGKVDENKLVNKIQNSYQDISKNNDFTIVEGTGHIGVGSLINLHNAKVCSLLGLNMVLIASGGVGSAFDALAVNKALCDQMNVKIAGVILNRVLDDKRDMVMTYIQKALKRWELPLLGCIPFDPFLSNPSMKDFEVLFNATLLSGEEFHMRHFRRTRLVATSIETYQKLILPSQLVITPSNREDIILATVNKQKEAQKDLEGGMILTGDIPPSNEIIKALSDANIPMLYTPLHSYNVMKRLTSYTVKIRKEDKEKIKEAVTLVENHIAFDALIGAATIS